MIGAAIVFLGVLSLTFWPIALGRLWRGQALVNYEGRRQVPWGGLHVLAVIAVMLMIEPLVMLGAATLFGLPTAIEKIEPQQIAVLLSASVFGKVLIMLMAAGILMIGARPRLSDLGFDFSHWKHDLGAGLLMLALVGPLVYLLQLALVTWWMPSEHPIVKLTRLHPTGGVIFVMILLAAVVAPLEEEFVFRVVIQGWLEKSERARPRTRRWSQGLPWGAGPIFVSSLPFALLHLGHGPDPIPLFFLALALGYLYRQTHRVVPSLVLHMAFNSLSVILLGVSLLMGEPPAHDDAPDEIAPPETVETHRLGQCQRSARQSTTAPPFVVPLHGNLGSTNRFRPRRLAQLPASELATLVKVVLAFVPTERMDVKQTITMSANITAYSTAVGPLSSRISRRSCFRTESIDVLSPSK